MYNYIIKIQNMYFNKAEKSIHWMNTSELRSTTYIPYNNNRLVARLSQKGARFIRGFATVGSIVLELHPPVNIT